MLHPLNEVLSPPFCYELWEAMCSISSLFDGALDAVMNNFIYFERELHCLPPNVKSRIAQRMCKRGLMTDHNAPLVLHDGIVELDLTDNDFGRVCVRHISLFCPRLLKLNLSISNGCRNNINSLDLSNLFSQCKKLQVLNLKGCVLMDNTAVGVLAKHCSYLLSLSLSGCHMISDRGIMMLSERCQYLQALDLTRTKISTEGLISLSRGKCASKLKELKVSQCINITDEGIQAIIKYCTRLTYLDVNGCPILNNITSNSLTRLKQVAWTVY